MTTGRPRQRSLALGLHAALALGSAGALWCEAARAQVLPLDGLDGQNGFRINGVVAN